MAKTIKKVLFLDIDGVLNRAEYGKDLYEDTYGDQCLCLHRPSVEALKKLLMDISDLKIVWITNWAKGNKEACQEQHCYLSPLIALEHFSWIKDRVIGDIWTEAEMPFDKLSLISKFVKDNFVQHYAILDDDQYDVIDVNLNALNHLVKINPLKSFLEDDIKKTKIALDLPINGKMLHEILIDCKCPFIVNGLYECCLKPGTSFSKFEKESNSPRMISKAYVSVKNIESNEELDGYIVLNDDSASNLTIHYSTSFYVKHLNADNWEFWTNIREIEIIN